MGAVLLRHNHRGAGVLHRQEDADHDRAENAHPDGVGELDRRPKGVQWRLRARIGDRVRWYEEPEEDY